jgi:hypothetical protein
MLILIGGAVLVPLVTATVGSLDTGKPPVFLVFWGVFVVITVILVSLKSRLDPIRRRTDQTNRWRQQFPTQSQSEIQRFLQVVGESLGLQEMHTCKLSPDDRGGDLSRSFFDGMEGLEEILMAVEEAYGLDLPNDCLKTCANFGQLFAYVNQHSTGRPVSAAAQQHNQSERA